MHPLRSRLFSALLACLAPVAGFAGVQVIKDVAYLEEGRTQTLDMYLPDEPGTKPRPAIVWIHGGGWIGGSNRASRAISMGNTFAEKGYVVVAPAYLLGTLEKASWPTALHDCKNAVRFLRANAEKYNIDPDRIAVMGGSAGGHLALMVGYTTDIPDLEPEKPYPGVSSRVSAVGNFYGITNLDTRQRVDKDGNLTGVPSNGSNRKFLGEEGFKDRALWRYASPTTHVKPGVPPTFVTHGKRDATVNFQQATELVEKLEAAGVPHVFVPLEKAGHTYDLTHWNKQPLEIDLRPIVLDFLAKHLGQP